MAKKKDINDVTDEISLIMREVVEATEGNLLFEIGKTLAKHSDEVGNANEYRAKQLGENKGLQQRLQKIAKQGEELQINVAKNIGTFAGINTAPLEQQIKNGTKVVLLSGMEEKNKQVQKVYQLNKFNTSAQFVPDLKKSIVEQTELGIDKGLPVTFKNGRKIGYREYMEMAVRTGIQQEIGEQQLEIAKQASIVFFLCDEYADCADDHAEYQGKIYYNADYQNLALTDDAKQIIANAIKAKQFLSVQEVRDDAPYLTTRPNCRHRLIPVSIDEAIGEDLARVKTSVDSVRGNYRPENYEDLQEQRYLERTIRTNKKKYEFVEEALKTTKDKQSKANLEQELAKLRASISRQQGKMRNLLQSNPALSRERRRETRSILIKDLGVKYNLNKGVGGQTPPVTNTPPAAPAAPMVAQNKVIIEHFSMPEEKKEYLKAETFTVVKGENIVKQLFVGKPQEDLKTSKENSNDIKPLLKKQNFNEKPRVVGEAEFREILKKTPHLLIRTYADMGDKKPQKYRDDMLKGDFFVDNTGGAMYGRGMYFYRFDAERLDLNEVFDAKTPDTIAPDYNENKISNVQQKKLMAVADIVRYSMNSLIKSDTTLTTKNLEDKQFMFNTAAGDYNSKIRLDVVAIDPSAKIGMIDDIETEWANTYINSLPKEEQNEVSNIYKTWYKEKKIKDEHKEKLSKASKAIGDYINQKAKEFFNDPNQTVRDTYYLDKQPNGTVLQNQLYEDKKLLELTEIKNDFVRNTPTQTYNSYYQMKNEAKNASVRINNTQSFFALEQILTGTDMGVKATALGYHGYAVDYKEYMVITNRSALIVLDDNGEWNKGDNTRFDLTTGAVEQFIDNHGDTDDIRKLQNMKAKK